MALDARDLRVLHRAVGALGDVAPLDLGERPALGAGGGVHTEEEPGRTRDDTDQTAIFASIAWRTSGVMSVMPWVAAAWPATLTLRHARSTAPSAPIK